MAISFDETSVNFIDLVNLRKNNKVTGRLQDLADLENLEQLAMSVTTAKVMTHGSYRKTGNFA